MLFAYNAASWLCTHFFFKSISKVLLLPSWLVSTVTGDAWCHCQCSRQKMMDVLEMEVLEDTVYCLPLHTGICGVHCPSALHSTWAVPSNVKLWSQVKLQDDLKASPPAVGLLQLTEPCWGWGMASQVTAETQAPIQIRKPGLPDSSLSWGRERDASPHVRTLPLHDGFSLSQTPEEVHCRLWTPTCLYPSSQANVQVVFHGKLPGFGEHFLTPLAGCVKASHSTTEEMKEKREFYTKTIP